ncbi:MAG: sulfatase-like hydrolase/transferase [Candidatus Eisenbacteria bacterium]|nr:sulfatase-like hydrolase/transferase [Candidatus Eisenbacteria bacterium]
MRAMQERGPRTREAARARWVALALIVAWLASGGCTRDPMDAVPAPGPITGDWLAVPQPETPSNLILITLDTTRRDRLGCYGSTLGLTPHLDSLATEGLLFAEAVAPTPITLPSHTTILTGSDPPRHGVRNNGAFVLSDDAVTLTERLAERGYATGAILGAFPVAAQFGLDQGFAYYDDEFPLESRLQEWQTAQRRADAVTARALDWLLARGGEPFFCWIHYFDPHFPYDPPAAYRQRGDQPYDGEVAFMDAEIGGLLAGLRRRGALANSWLLIVADHGESLGEHEELAHSMLIYGATQLVPCLLVPPAGETQLPPGLRPGRRVTELVRLCDLANTMLNALGFDSTAAIGEGLSLLPMLAGAGRGPRVAYCETLVPFLEYGWSELRGIRTRDWSYIRAPAPELYDLRRDPDELHNLHASRPRIAGRLEAWCDRLTAAEQGLEMQPLDPATIERLRSLGYVAGGAPQGPARNAKDPKALMPLFHRINEARTALGMQQASRAVEILTAVLQEDPGNPEALRLLGTAHLRRGDGAAAVAVYDSLSQRVPEDREVRLGRARALLLAGRYQEAEAATAALLAAEPQREELLELQARVLQQGGQGEEAVARLAAQIARQPELAAPRVALARLHWAQGEMDAAEEAVREALAREPEHAGAQAILGECLWWRSAQAAAQGASAEATRLEAGAREALATAIALDPLEPVANFRLAGLAREDGDADRAIELYRRSLTRRPDWPETHVNLGNLLREAGRIDEALLAYETAQSLGFEEVSFLVNYGVALAMRGRLRDALLVWERALERAPDERYAEGIRRNLELLRGRMRGAPQAP